MAIRDAIRDALEIPKIDDLRCGDVFWMFFFLCLMVYLCIYIYIDIIYIYILI